MKISRNWLEQYINLDMSDDELAGILTDLGLEVEGMERQETVKGGLAGVVIGHVLTCEKHPDADKLSVTTVDLGNGEPVQIICGAPNVAAGQKVAVATVGATLYTSSGDSLEIKKAKIRGVFSEGMICAEDELGLGESHAGIMVLPEETPVGMSAAEFFRIETDTIFEIGLTPNRSDATSHLGVARDLSAFLRFNRDKDRYKVCEPGLADIPESGSTGSMAVEVRNPEACPRYSGLVIKGLSVGESPEWLKRRLQAIDVRPINNVVDITNFILHEMGQPLHAFDMREITGRYIIVQTLNEGTPFVTLDEQERKLGGEDLMICDGDGKGMCIAGVFGGLGSGVKDDTTEIFLESAHFAAAFVRKTSMRHLLRTDAAKVFEKGSDPSITVKALLRAAQMIIEICGGEADSPVIDIYPVEIAEASVHLRRDRVRQLIGIDISDADILRLLEVLDMEVAENTADGWEVKVPTNKSDVTREVDVIEELLRIYGFNQIPLGDDVRSTIARQIDERPQAFREKVSDVLEGLGFSEMMGLVLTPSRFLTEKMGVDASSLIYINNTSNIHLDAMRPCLLVTALEAVRHNLNRQQLDLRLFEIGKKYQTIEGKYTESWQLALTMVGDRFPESWLNMGAKDVGFHTLKGNVEALLSKTGMPSWRVDEIPAGGWYHYGLTYRLGKDEFVRFGAIHPNLLKDADIKQPVWFAEFDLEVMMRFLGKSKLVFSPIPKYPESRRDLALVMDEKVDFSELQQLAVRGGGKLLRSVDLFDVYRHDEHIGPGKKSYALSFIFRDDEKTIQDKQVDAVMQNLVSSFAEKLGAIVRQ